MWASVNFLFDRHRENLCGLTTLVKMAKTKFTAFLAGVRGSLATSAHQGLQDLLADREAKRNKASSAFCREPYLSRARKPVVRPKAKPRKPVVRPKAKPKRKNKKKKELKDAVKAEELEIVSAPSSYPQYVGDTSDDEDELPLCLLQLLGSGEEGDQVPTTPDNITEHLSSSLKSQLKDDVPAQIKQAFRTSRERRWATGVLRLKQVDTSRDLD